MRHLVYPLFGILVLGGYGYYAATGRDPGATHVLRRVAPAGARGPGGGYRPAPIFWYGGYSGGK